MVYRHDNVSGLDAAILMHPTTWKASGHVDAFNDPYDRRQNLENEVPAPISLIEGHIDRLRRKGQRR